MAFRTIGLAAQEPHREKLQFRSLNDRYRFCINSKTGIENKRGRLLLVSGGCHRLAIRDHIAADRCEGMSVGKVATQFASGLRLFMATRMVPIPGSGNLRQRLSKTPQKINEVAPPKMG